MYKKLTKEELDKILNEHAKWLENPSAGKKADLSSANLAGVDLSSADLSGANLRYANLSGADLSGADLTHVYLSDAILSKQNKFENIMNNILAPFVLTTVIFANVSVLLALLLC
jgi:uncharacterized protein YjbI with pentapeptide repeats